LLFFPPPEAFNLSSPFTYIRLPRGHEAKVECRRGFSLSFLVLYDVFPRPSFPANAHMSYFASGGRTIILLSGWGEAGCTFVAVRRLGVVVCGFLAFPAPPTGLGGGDGAEHGFEAVIVLETPFFFSKSFGPSGGGLCSLAFSANKKLSGTQWYSLVETKWRYHFQTSFSPLIPPLQIPLHVDRRESREELFKTCL